MSNLVILKGRPFEYKAEFDIFFKRPYEQSFENLQ